MRQANVTVTMDKAHKMLSSGHYDKAERYYTNVINRCLYTQQFSDTYIFAHWGRAEATFLGLLEHIGEKESLFANAHNAIDDFTTFHMLAGTRPHLKEMEQYKGCEDRIAILRREVLGL